MSISAVTGSLVGIVIAASVNNGSSGEIHVLSNRSTIELIFLESVRSVGSKRDVDPGMTAVM